MMGNLFLNLARLVEFAVTVYIWIVIIRVLLSWVNPNPYNPIVRFLIQATEPVLGRIRAFVPDLGGLDISPIILIVLLYLAKSVVVGMLLDLAHAMS